MFWNYTKLTFKSSILHIIFILDLVGMLTTYFTRINIPYWIFLLLPALAFYFTGYLIYKNSSPTIMIGSPDKDDIEIKYKPVNFDKSCSFEILMKSRITNFGLKSGSLEDVQIKFITFNGIKDEYLLKNLKISVDNPQILKKKPTILMSMKPKEYEFEYPVIIPADDYRYLYFYTTLYIGSNFGSGEEQVIDTIEWIKSLEFELQYKYKDMHNTNTKKSKINIDLYNLNEIYNKGKKDQKATEEAFKSLEEDFR